MSCVDQQRLAFAGHLQGSPAILSVPVLQPCLRAEQLLVTVDTHTGMLQCHVPQYDAPLMPELQTALNGDHSRLPTLVSELRYGFNIISYEPSESVI
jgi:mediator of RNA polymerase II transcription subunit 14